LENKCICYLSASHSPYVAVTRRWEEERGDVAKGYNVSIFPR
jgi:hypothetical protein